MSKKWVAVIPCGNEVIPTILELKKMGYNVVGIDQNKDAVAFEHCDIPIVAPLNDYETILYSLKVKNVTPEYFIPIVSDKAVLPAYILNILHGLGKKNENILAYYSKSILRDTLQKNKLPTPEYFIISDKKQLSEIDVKNKLIVKPDDSSGSRGISILDSITKTKLHQAFEFAINYSANKKVIIEEYISGEEYMIDCFVWQNQLKALLVSQKKKIADKVSYLIYTLNKTEFPYDKLETFLQKLVSVLKYEQGPMHIELKYVNGKFHILDLAVRGGGFGVFNYYVHKSLGFDFVKATIEVNLNKKLSQKVQFHKEGMIYFLTPEKPGIINKITCSYIPQKNEDVRIDYYYKKGQSLTMEVNDGNRLAGIYCFADNKDSLTELFDKVKKSIKITYIDESKRNTKHN